MQIHVGVEMLEDLSGNPHNIGADVLSLFGIQLLFAALRRVLVVALMTGTVQTIRESDQS